MWQKNYAFVSDRHQDSDSVYTKQLSGYKFLIIDKGYACDGTTLSESCREKEKMYLARLSESTSQRQHSALDS